MVRNNQDVRLILSELELRVALLAKTGLKRWEIAQVLGIREGTVKSQLERIKGKLGDGWKEAPYLFWPELSEELKEAINNLRSPAPILFTRAAHYTGVRQAEERALSPAEAVILQLQGQCSPAGKRYLQKARSTQWRLIQLGHKGQALFVSGGARFWLRPALVVLVENKYLKFFQSDSSSELYRPAWLPYVIQGRARGTRAAYYKITGIGTRDYVQRYLSLWVAGDLEVYVAQLHTRMEQRWQALSRMARLAGKSIPPPPPSLEMLLEEARSFLIPRQS